MVDFLDKLNRASEAQDAENNISLAYRQIFSDEKGKLVLQDMLYELYFLRPATTPEQQTLCNYAKTLLSKIYGGEIEFTRLEGFFRKLLKRRNKDE